MTPSVAFQRAAGPGSGVQVASKSARGRLSSTCALAPVRAVGRVHLAPARERAPAARVAEPRRHGCGRGTDRHRYRHASQPLVSGAGDESDDPAGTERRQRRRDQRPRIGQPARRRRQRGMRPPGARVVGVFGAQGHGPHRDVGGGRQGGRFADGAAGHDPAQQPGRVRDVELRVDHQRASARRVRCDREHDPSGRQVAFVQVDLDTVGPFAKRQPALRG